MKPAGAGEPGLVSATRPADFGPPDALRTIVTRPRATIRWVLDHGDGGLWVLLGLGGIAFLASHIARDLAHETSRQSGWIAACLVAGATVAVETMVLLAAFRFVAWGFGGVGSIRATAIALAWGAWPFVVALPLWVLERLTPAPSAWKGVLILLTGPVAVGATLVLCGFTIAEAHRLPPGRAVATTLLASLVVAVFELSTYGFVYAWFIRNFG